MSPRRIGIDVTSALTQGGGIGRYTRELVQALVALNPTDEIHYFSARLSDKSREQLLPRASNVVFHEAPFGERWLYRLWYRARLPLPIQWFTGPLDLYHSPDFVLPPVAKKIPTLLTVHDLSFVHYPDTFPVALVNYLNRIVPWSVTRADHILADSKSTKGDLISLWSVPDEKITVLYSGVKEQFRPISDQEAIASARQKYGIDNRPYVLAVGTVQPRKNYQMLIRSFRKVAEHLPHNLVVIGGRGWLNDEVRNEVSRQNLTERVVFTGFVEDVDLPALYNGASLLAFPSLYEGFGLPILEAMSCGLPCLISNTSSLPEVGGMAAIQISPHDEALWTENMIELLSSPEKLIQMKNSGLEQSSLFSWNQAAKELMQIYDYLLESRQ